MTPLGTRHHVRADTVVATFYEGVFLGLHVADSEEDAVGYADGVNATVMALGVDGGGYVMPSDGDAMKRVEPQAWVALEAYQRRYGT